VFLLTSCILSSNVAALSTTRSVDKTQTLAHPERGWQRRTLFTSAPLGVVSLLITALPAYAGVRIEPTRPKTSDYDAPVPEVEGPGLVVLRVAEVCAFQEKLLRAFAAGDNEDFDGFAINSVQIAFGTKVLLKNSNLDGNLKLIVRNARKGERDSAVSASVASLNTIGKIYEKASESTATLTSPDMLAFADLYHHAQAELMVAFAALPTLEQEKYFGYARELKAYEDEIAKGDAIEY